VCIVNSVFSILKLNQLNIYIITITTLQTVNFDRNQLQDLVDRRPAECSGVLANSPIVTMTADNIAAIGQGTISVTVPLFHLKFNASDHNATAPSVKDINPTGTNAKRKVSVSQSRPQTALSKASEEFRFIHAWFCFEHKICVAVNSYLTYIG
jgi:hypothetical protein